MIIMFVDVDDGKNMMRDDDDDDQSETLGENARNEINGSRLLWYLNEIVLLKC